VVKSEAALPARPAASRDDADEDTRVPAISASAADSMARGSDIPHDPVRPFTSGSKPSRTMPSPGKFVTTEPGGWPPTIDLAVPRAGGIGASSRAGISQTPDGRFQER
jgi:hypothetical protein